MRIRTLSRSAPTGKRRRCGLTLVETILGLSVCVSILVALQLFGFAAVVSAFRAIAVVLTLTVLWGLAYLRAPDLTRNATALLFVAVLTLSVLPIRALYVREAARRQTVRNSLREIGQDMRVSQDAGPRGEPGGSRGEDQQSASSAESSDSRELKQPEG